MTFEERLAAIDNTLKAILVALQSGGAAQAALGTATLTAAADTAGETTKTRTKKNTDTKTDEAGAATKPTPYYISKDGTAFYEVNGDATPPTGARNVSHDEWLAAKAEYVKKQNDAAAPAATAGTAPTATPQADAASTTSQADDVTFKQVVESLTMLSKDKRPGRGRDGVLAILNKHLADLPEAERKVPKLEGLKINGQLLAEVNAALAEDAVAEVDLF